MFAQQVLPSLAGRQVTAWWLMLSADHSLYQKLLVDNNKALALRKPGIHEKVTSENTENLHSLWSSGFLP
jgi:hypothetical protein